MQRHIEEIRSEGTLPPVAAFRTYGPEERVHARLEITGPGLVRRPVAGVDVKGDGTLVPFQGEIFKKPLEPGRGKTELDAVREALGG
jgi:hypothetical protein